MAAQVVARRQHEQGELMGRVVPVSMDMFTDSRPITHTQTHYDGPTVKRFESDRVQVGRPPGPGVMGARQMLGAQITTPEYPGLNQNSGSNAILAAMWNKKNGSLSDTMNVPVTMDDFTTNNKIVVQQSSLYDGSMGMYSSDPYTNNYGTNGSTKPADERSPRASL